jgi:hypothetical protein
LFANEALEPRIWLATGIIIGSVIFINSTRPKASATIAPHVSEHEAKKDLVESNQ